MTVVIAGCGDVGTEAGLRFVAAGHRVLGLRRRAEVLPDRFDTCSVDLARAVLDVPADTQTVVFAAAPDERSAQAYRDAYLRAPANLLDALDRAGARPKRVLLVSSTSVFGAVDDGRWLNEDSPADPTPVTGETVHAGEEQLLQRVPGAVVLRLSGLYGPGRNRMISKVRDGTARTGGPIHYTNRIHRDDAAAAIVHLIDEAPEASGVYLGTDCEPAPRDEVTAYLAASCGTDVQGAGTDRAAPPSGKRLSNRRLRDTGFTFTYPGYREGYRAVLDGAGVRHP